LLLRRAVVPSCARLGKLLNTTPQSWLAMQTALDLWRVAQDSKKLTGIKPIRATA
jgi:plasmid maintenance system antidote protein VapI